MMTKKGGNMNDQGAMPLGLAQQRVARKIEPAQLELMGKKAAAFFEKNDATLSESVVEIVKEARLAPEQVKRVCEFANTSAYLNEFEKGGEYRNITFSGGPANPGVVLKELNDGSAPAVHQVKTADYNPPKDHYKTRFSDNIIAEAFGHKTMDGIEKRATRHQFRYQSKEELADLRSQLDGMRDHFVSKLSSIDVLRQDVKAELCKVASQEVLNGATLLDIIRVWAPYGEAQMIKEALSNVREVLLQREIMGKEEQSKSLNKVAAQGMVPNPDHPLVELFLEYTKVASEQRKLETSIGMVDEQLAMVNAKLGLPNGP